jgi:drug/metabolite transporter (DMT)-like permease
MSSRRPALLVPALALNVLIASGTFLIAKSALRDFPPLMLALFRFTLATALLWPVTRLMRPAKRIAPEDRRRILLLGFLAVPANQALFLYGMQWASASHAALLYALTPTFIILIEARPAFLGGLPDARPTLRQVVGVGLAFAGVLSLLLQRGIHFDPHSLRGDLLVLGAVVAWALYLHAGRTVTRCYGPLLVTSEALLAGTLMYLPVGLVALRGFHPATVSPGGWWGLVYLAWLTSGLNYVIWFWGVEHLRPAATAVWSNLQPPTTAVMARLLFHEPLPAGFLLSAALVLGGVWIAQGPRPRPGRGPGIPADAGGI